MPGSVQSAAMASSSGIAATAANGGILTAADEPKAEFVLAEGEKALRAYEYCNLHGQWRSK